MVGTAVPLYTSSSWAWVMVLAGVIKTVVSLIVNVF